MTSVASLLLVEPKSNPWPAWESYNLYQKGLSHKFFCVVNRSPKIMICGNPIKVRCFGRMLAFCRAASNPELDGTDWLFCFDQNVRFVESNWLLKFCNRIPEDADLVAAAYNRKIVKSKNPFVIKTTGFIAKRQLLRNLGFLGFLVNSPTVIDVALRAFGKKIGYCGGSAIECRDYSS